MNLKLKRKQKSGSIFENKDLKNHGSAWSLENSSTFSEKTYWCIALRYPMWLACTRNCDMYRWICNIWMHTCAHTHSFIHPLTHTLGDIPVSWAKVNYASLYVYYISFPIQKIIVFLIMYTFFRCICRRFQDSKFERTFKT